MIIEALGLEEELIILHPGECPQQNHERQEGTQSKTQLRADFQVFKFHAFSLRF
jgi:hypothetical protein